MQFFVMFVTAVCVISHKLRWPKKKNINDKVGINGENNCKVVRTFSLHERRHSIKSGLDPRMDSGPWTLDSGLQIKIENGRKK